MQTFEWLSHSEADTGRLAHAVAAALPPQLVITLEGTLGAGKTRFVQQLAAALGYPAEEVTSPTYVLVHEYATPRGMLIHCDAYRLRDADEFWDLGGDEYLAQPGWCCIEWASRIAAALPSERLQIDLEPLNETTRRCTLTAHGSAAEQLIAEISRSLT